MSREESSFPCPPSWEVLPCAIHGCSNVKPTSQTQRAPLPLTLQTSSFPVQCNIFSEPAAACKPVSEPSVVENSTVVPMQCGMGSRSGDRLVENYSGLLPLLWKAAMRYKESRAWSTGSYAKLGERNGDVLEQSRSGGKHYHSAKPSSTSFVSSGSSRRRRWRVMFRVPKAQGGWGVVRPAHRLRRHYFSLPHG